MVRIILIAAGILLVIHLIESFFYDNKIVKVDPKKLQTLKKIFSSEDSAMLISRAIRHTIEMEQWRSDRARQIKEEKE